ncbi:MAG: transcription antitermination factor NusB [Armatimonadota bacterium]|nr:transcription antitermination factor NusB [Armatimonadota bacterium]MDR5703112.1 transcription antitermination factor NusB [Armatimonadota bacterium]MDR7435564.1 transcription antitermination factor NusB [Armatimonadota bacterium]
MRSVGRAAGKRRKSREAAFQLLFQCDVGKIPLSEGLAELRKRPWDPQEWEFVETLCRGTWERREELDLLIGRYASGWTVPRMAAVDRTILRMAAYELLHMETPASVVINEAVELAKKFGTEDSGRFVNGVLGAIFRNEVASTKVE